MAPTPHPSPLPREREPVFQGIDGHCSEPGSLADVRKTPPCEALKGGTSSVSISSFQESSPRGLFRGTPMTGSHLVELHPKPFLDGLRGLRTEPDCQTHSDHRAG